MLSIMRKFLVKVLPDLSGKIKTTYIRYYLYIGNKAIVRVQAVNGNYEIERKTTGNNLLREEQKIQISKDEFDELTKLSHQYILRDSYDISENPKTVLRIYHGDYEGLTRIEVGFNSEKEALSFISPNWFGKEITASPLAQDGRLLQLTKKEFNKLLEKGSY